jgi:ribonuclease P protein component
VARYGFGGSLRLLRGEEFQRVFDGATRSGEPGLTVLARANGLDHPRLGLVVSRKCARAAARRNRIKRVSREAFRTLQHRLGGLDFVVLGRPGLDGRAKSDLRAAVERHLLRLAARCKAS